jgi:nucleoside-diphosphate-sugar epimerase
LWPGEKVQAVQADLTEPQSLAGACAGVEAVFHLASYAHAEPDPDGGDAQRHRRVTIEGTRALLDAAVRAGVRRFVFFSSVKAMGEGDASCLDEGCTLPPVTAYGQSKRAAERLVMHAGQRHGLHVCALRLPLVYGGSGAKGNLPRMIAAVRRHLFPPLPEVGNRRSVVHVEDVVRAALLAAENRRAGGQTYIVTDGEVYSTRQLYDKICRALGRPAPAWSVPMGLLRAAARLGDGVEQLNRHRFPINSDALQKLTGSAWYSSRKISDELGYRPEHNLDSALLEMVAQGPR